jgi:hypothetical protein
MKTSQENVSRIAEIKEQIKTLTEEVMQLADVEGITVDFWDMPFSQAYGAGNMRYYSQTAADRENEEGYAYDEYERGWKTSGSDEC